MGLLLQTTTVAGEPGMVKVRDPHYGNSDGFEKMLELSMQGAKNGSPNWRPISGHLRVGELCRFYLHCNGLKLTRFLKLLIYMHKLFWHVNCLDVFVTPYLTPRSKS